MRITAQNLQLEFPKLEPLPILLLFQELFTNVVVVGIVEGEINDSLVSIPFSYSIVNKEKISNCKDGLNIS